MPLLSCDKCEATLVSAGKQIPWRCIACCKVHGELPPAGTWLSYPGGINHYVARAAKAICGLATPKDQWRLESRYAERCKRCSAKIERRTPPADMRPGFRKLVRAARLASENPL